MHYTELQLKQLLKSSEGDTIQQSISLDHLESCEKCQQALSDLAGEGQWFATWADQACQEEGEQWKDEEELTAQFVPGISDGNITVALNSEMRREEGNFTTDLSMVSTDFLQPAVHPELLGRLGRYDVERLVGAGGFGIVFKAHDTELRRVVALKVLAPHLMSSGAARRRFARESQAAAAIVQQHVVPIYDVVSDPEVSYLVMQYVSGGSLQERVDKDGPLALEDVLRIGMQIARGLSAAHQQGVVHRDVKPGNILLEDSVDRVLISDFGLARTADDANLTRSGVITGTPHYMSPEQATGSYIDTRSDLFSLGSVLFFMLTGRPPFRAPQVIAVLNRICTHPHRPVEHINSSVPVEVAELIDRLLQKNADDRPQTAEDVAQELQELLQRHQAGSLTRSSKPRFNSPAKNSETVVEGETVRRKQTLKMLPIAVVACSILAAFLFGIGVARPQDLTDKIASLTQTFFPGQQDPESQLDQQEFHRGSIAKYPEPNPQQPVPGGSFLNNPIPGLETGSNDDASPLFPLAGDVPGSGAIVIRSEPLKENTPEIGTKEIGAKEIVSSTKLEAKEKIQIVKIVSPERALELFNKSFRVRQFGIFDNETQEFFFTYAGYVEKQIEFGDLTTVALLLYDEDPFRFFDALGYWEEGLQRLDKDIEGQISEIENLKGNFQFLSTDKIEAEQGSDPQAAGDSECPKCRQVECRSCEKF